MRPTTVAVCLTLLALVLAGCAAKEDEESAKNKSTPASASVSAAALNKSLHEAAMAAERAGDYKPAVTFYNNLFERDQTDKKAALGLARNLRYIGAAGPAADVLARALAHNPDDPAIVSELGKAQLAAGQPEEALASLIRARELSPGDWRIHSALGIVYDRLGRYDSARLNYQAALERSPNNVSVLNNLALSYVQSAELERGIDILTRAVLLPRVSIQVRQNLALLYALKGDIDEAEKLARRDLPEKMLQKNLEYYRMLAASRSAAGSRPVVAPLSQATASATGTVPLLIVPWDEDLDAERVGTLQGGDN